MSHFRNMGEKNGEQELTTVECASFVRVAKAELKGCSAKGEEEVIRYEIHASPHTHMHLRSCGHQH